MNILNVANDAPDPRREGWLEGQGVAGVNDQLVHPRAEWDGLVVHGHIDYRAAAICGSRAHISDSEGPINCRRCLQEIVRRRLEVATESPPVRAGWKGKEYRE